MINNIFMKAKKDLADVYEELLIEADIAESIEKEEFLKL